MNMTKIFGVLLLCSIFTLNAVLTEDEKEDLGDSLISVAKWGNYDKVKECLDAGADVNFRGEEYKETPLHWAVYRGDVEMTKLLVGRGADVNAKNGASDTPLILVIKRLLSIKEKGCLEIMGILLGTKEIDVNYKNKFSETALLWAALQQKVAVCELLLKHKASVNIADDEWEYPADVVRRSEKLKKRLWPTGLYRFIHWLKD